MREVSLCDDRAHLARLSAFVLAMIFRHAFILAVACLSTLRCAAQVDDDASRLLRAQVEAGEFAPALRQATALKRAENRDAWLARIAQAQANSGAADAALDTIGEMQSDLARGQALERFPSFSQPPAPQGGGAEADFESLINLITSTVAPTTWDDVGGSASIREFPGGVYVDADGVLRQTMTQDRSGRLMLLAAASAEGGKASPVSQHPSVLRKVSLSRLERHVQLLRSAGRGPDETMRMLAGLQRIEYVMVYPQSGDLVIAGPAGPWRRDASGRPVGRNSGRPVLQLDDFVVMLRHFAHRGEPIGCSINPSQTGLAAVKQLAAETGSRSLQHGERERWMERLRGSLGQQSIDVFGIDPRTRVARVFVEADYHMKLIGLGLEPGTLGVSSYLDSIKLPPGASPPPMDVLRWWFTLDFGPLWASEDRTVFELRGQGVKVLSENELLARHGQRRHTGRSSELNHRFASSFTRHFDQLAAKYPVYADLRNVCSLALVAALIQAEKLDERAGCHLEYFSDPATYAIAFGPAPRHVESVVNSRKVNGRVVVAAVSGGVDVNPWPLVEREAIRRAAEGRLDSDYLLSRPASGQSLETWWWD